MKPILPKNAVERTSRPHGLVASPRTTIILAPTLSLATPQVSSFVLPSQLSLCEVVPPPQCLPQPSPVMLPITPNPQGQPPTLHLQLTSHLPSSIPRKLDIKCRNLTTSSKSSGKKMSAASQSSDQLFPGRGVRTDKAVKAILPKAPPAVPQTMIVLPAMPSHKPVVSKVVPTSVPHNDPSTLSHSKKGCGYSKKSVNGSSSKPFCQGKKEFSTNSDRPVDIMQSEHKTTARKIKEKTYKSRKHYKKNSQAKSTAELTDRSMRKEGEYCSEYVEVESGESVHTPDSTQHCLPPSTHQSTTLPTAQTPGDHSSLQSEPELHEETLRMKPEIHQQLLKKCEGGRKDSGDASIILSCDTRDCSQNIKCAYSKKTPLDTVSKTIPIGSSFHSSPSHSPPLDTKHTSLLPLKLHSHPGEIQTLNVEQKTPPVGLFSSSNGTDIGNDSPASSQLPLVHSPPQVPVSPCQNVSSLDLLSSSVPASHYLSTDCVIAATTQSLLFSVACSYTDSLTHSTKQLHSYPLLSHHSKSSFNNSESFPSSSQSASYSSSSFPSQPHLVPPDASSCAREPHSTLDPAPLPSPHNTALYQQVSLSSCQSPPPYAQQSPHYSCSQSETSPFSHSTPVNSFLSAVQPFSVTAQKASSYIYPPQQAHAHFPQSSYLPSQPTSDAQSTKVMPYTQSQQQMLYVESPQPAPYEHTPDSYAHSPQTNMDSQYHHLSSYSQSPHVHQSPQSTPHFSSQGLKFSGQLDSHITYNQSPHTPTCSLSLSHIASDNESHSPQALSLLQGYKDSYEPSQSDSCLSFNPDTLENANLSGVMRNMTRSPASSLMMPSTSQCLPNPPHLLSSMHQTDIGHDSLIYNAQKNHSFTSYSVETNYSPSSLHRSLSPPSYEAHLQTTALYQSSEQSSVKPQYGQPHQQKTPANYSLAYHNPEADAQLSPMLCKGKESCPPAYPHHFPAPPPPQYTPKRQIRYTDPAAVSSQSKECSYKDASPHVFYPSTPPLAPPPPAPPPLHGLETEVHAYHSESDAVYSHGATPFLASHSHQRQDHERLLHLGDSDRTKPSCEDMDKQHSQETDISSDWKPCPENVKVHSLIENAKRLWFIPHQEQNKVYLKRKELARNILSHSESYSKRDLMLKETFWIEEDEPISDEILSCVLKNEAGEEQDGQLERAVEERREKEKQQHQSGAGSAGSRRGQSQELLCQMCGKLVKGRRSLRTHLQSHQGIQPHACPSCPKRFTHRSVLVEHLRIHTGAMPYSCSQCSASFRTRSALRRHGSLHTSLRPYKCPTCSKTFKTKLVLQQHLKLHSSGSTEGGGPRAQARKTLSPRPHRYKCPQCHKGYHFLSLLNHHMQVHLGIRKHVCEICGHKFVWRSGLVAHMNTHSTSRPQCDVCGAQFASEKRLESHYSKRHTNPPCYKCEVCGRSFMQAYRLAYHSLLHKKDRDYRCEKCDVTVTSIKKFRKHIASHKKEKPSICIVSGSVNTPESTS